MADDPRIHWDLASPYGISINEAEDAWWSGHISDVLELDEGNAGLLVATETGGAWYVAADGTTLPLSNSWDQPDVSCLAVGPDGTRHFFAGCNREVWNSGEKKLLGVIYETDASVLAPLLDWKPIDSPLPASAGRLNRIAILSRHRRIIAACDGGLYWSEIPKTPGKRGCLSTFFPKPTPPRPLYSWQRADEEDKGQNGYFSVTVGSLSGKTERPGEEDLRRVSIVAGGKNSGVFLGRWKDSGNLVLQQAKLDEQGLDVTDWWFLSTGATSVAVCERYPHRLYAACSYPDGRFNESRIIQ